MTTTANAAPEITRQEQIALLNDRVRLGRDPQARIVVTRNCLDQLAEVPGAPEEGFALQSMLLAAFRECSFSDDSPERDFAAITFLDRKVWMKVDYYAPGLEFGSEDPADPAQTVRVMTILLPEDY